MKFKNLYLELIFFAGKTILKKKKYPAVFLIIKKKTIPSK